MVQLICDGYMQKYRKRKPGYLTFRRQVRLGLIDKDSVYEEWVKDYEPGKQHKWLKQNGGNNK